MNTTSARKRTAPWFQHGASHHVTLVTIPAAIVRSTRPARQPRTCKRRKPRHHHAVRTRLIVTVLAACPATSGADRVRDAVDAVPELGTVEHGRAHVVVRGELGKAARREALHIADEVIADVERRFTRATTKADPTVTLCLMPNDARFLEVARTFGEEPPSTWGFYRPDHRIAIINWGQSIGNLRHELVHPLIGDDFPAIPAWLNEGIAALYGTARPTARGFEFLVNYRLRDLQHAIGKNELPTVAELAISTDADVYGPRAGVYYAMSRYVLLFVERSGKLSQLYGELRAAGDAAKQRDILTRYVDDKQFVAWAKRLRL